MKPALFIDRDGTLNRMVYDSNHGIMDSPRRPDQVSLIPGAGVFLKEARHLGYFLVIVTNQPGIAKGTLTLPELDSVHQRLAELLDEEAAGARWDALYFSPYHPAPGPGGRSEYTGVTDCRKPEPGMLLKAAAEHDLDLSRSWMIGDGIVDVQAGRRAGCRTLLLTSLKIQQVEQFFDLSEAKPDHVVSTFAKALAVIREAV